GSRTVPEQTRRGGPPPLAAPPPEAFRLPGPACGSTVFGIPSVRGGAVAAAGRSRGPPSPEGIDRFRPAHLHGERSMPPGATGARNPGADGGRGGRRAYPMRRSPRGGAQAARARGGGGEGPSAVPGDDPPA